MKPLVPFLSLLVSAGLASTAADAPPPAPFGPVPTERQLRWHEMEFYGFLHFTVNTFTDREWGYGDEGERIFNPTAFDADQIVRTVREAGMKGLILTAKHHDGFCLWPSRFTEHSVKNSPWKDGKGDVVKEISEACRKQGVRFGVYLSPWDRNHKDYARPEYITYYRNQIRELLTNYGDIFTVWFDGANGGDGFYGGKRETRRIDNRTYYDWPNTWTIVRELMPMAVMFSDAGPDFRWVGNEAGVAGDPCWATLDMTKPGRYPGGSSSGLNSGERPGTAWMPAECDVSIRPGWFYHASEDTRVKTSAKLLDIYYKSVGRGACLNLNLPPDRRGRIHENDVAALKEFRRILDDTFAKNLAAGAKLVASNVRGQGAKAFAVENLLDGDRYSCWATDDAVTNADVVLDLGRPATFNVVDLRENIKLGQRVDAFALDQWKEGTWKEFAKGTSIGNRRLLRGTYVTTDKVRLRITQAAACPAISEIALHAEPVMLGQPKIARDKQGFVSISLESPGPHVHYSLDGSEPTPDSPKYEAPFPLPRGGTVRARAFSPEGKTPDEKPASPTTTEVFGLAKTKWKVVSASYQSPGGGEASRAIDDRSETLWNTFGPQGERKPPQEIVVDLGETMELTAFIYQPRRDGISKGMVDKFEFFLSEDGQQWTAVAGGEFANIKANPILQTVPFKKPVSARYFRFVALRVVESSHIAVAEIGVVAK